MQAGRGDNGATMRRSFMVGAGVVTLTIAGLFGYFYLERRSAAAQLEAKFTEIDRAAESFKGRSDPRVGLVAVVGAPMATNLPEPGREKCVIEFGGTLRIVSEVSYAVIEVAYERPDAPETSTSCRSGDKFYVSWRELRAQNEAYLMLRRICPHALGSLTRQCPEIVDIVYKSER